MLLADDSHRGFSVPAGELMVQPDGRTSIADPPGLRWLLRVCGIQRWEGGGRLAQAWNIFATVLLYAWPFVGPAKTAWQVISGSEDLPALYKTPQFTAYLGPWLTADFALQAAYVFMFHRMRHLANPRSALYSLLQAPVRLPGQVQ